MKTKAISPFLMFLSAAIAVKAQGTFQNLDFEQAKPVSIIGNPFYPYAVTPASALPHWTVETGGEPASEVFFNTQSEGAASIDLFGPGWNQLSPGIIDGKYTVFLQANEFNSGSISQIGTVPVNSKSIQFKSADILGSGPLDVSFAGINLSPILLSSGTSPSGQPYDVYEADISPYANQTGELQFTVPIISPYFVELDDISFSPVPVVPEPSITTLSAIGGLLLYTRRWFARR
jgi:hypothetical protein